jgi:hypothetical protein
MKTNQTKLHESSKGKKIFDHNVQKHYELLVKSKIFNQAA